MRLFALPAALAASIGLTAFGTAWLALPQRQANTPTSAIVDAHQARSADLSRVDLSRAEPTDASGWHALGRERAARGLHADALVAFRSAARLRPDDARLLTDYAFSAAVTTRRTAADEPRRLVERALLIDPTHGEALVLAGTLALDRSDFDAAVQYWERLAQLQPADSAARRQIRASIAQTRRLAATAERPVELAKAP